MNSMEDKIMRKTNNTVANNKMRRMNSESYDHYQLRIITTDPQGSKEVLVKNYKKGENPALELEEFYNMTLSVYGDKVIESFFGGDRFWVSNEWGFHKEAYIKKIS